MSIIDPTLARQDAEIALKSAQSIDAPERDNLTRNVAHSCQT
jgi:hypothetical protein